MVDLSNIYGGYLKAGRYSSLKDSDLTKALKPYGISLNALRGNKRTPDIALRRQAVKAVLARRSKLKIKRPTTKTTTRGTGKIQPISSTRYQTF